MDIISSKISPFRPRAVGPQTWQVGCGLGGALNPRVQLPLAGVSKQLGCQIGVRPVTILPWRWTGDEAGVTVALLLDDGPVVLWAPLAMVEKVGTMVVGGHRFAGGTPSEALMAIWLFLLDGTVADLTQFNGHDVQICGLLTGAHQISAYMDAVLWEIGVEVAVVQGAQEAGDGDRWMVRLFGRQLPMPSGGGDNQPAIRPAHDLEVRCRLVVGRTSLLRHQWASLEKGDLVTLDWLAVPDSRAGDKAQLLCGDQVAAVRLTSWDEIEIIDSLSTKERSMSGENRLNLQLSEDEPLENPSVTVTVELGQTTLSWGVLSSLLPGQLVGLNRPADGEVFLRSGERRLARGVLVTYENQLAVEVTDVY